MKLNIGAGEHNPEGYTPIDLANGQDARRLDYPDNSVDEIRASHVLEHFGHREVCDVLREWVRVLKPGGLMKLAVPNFEMVARDYLDGKQINIQGYAMGGQMDANDFHRTLFDRECLGELMTVCGLQDIAEWKSEIEDCASLPISLNLCGTKRVATKTMPAHMPKIGVAMSVPRVGWMDNFFSCFESLSGFGFPIIRHTGVYWGQCLTRCFEDYLRDYKDVEAIFTVDYDTIFKRQDVVDLINLFNAHPEAAAIAPMQSGRQRIAPLLTIANGDGTNCAEVNREVFDAQLVEVHSAHFGLTIIRADALRQMPKPWFCEHPDENGTWGVNKIDADIHFWQQVKKGGFRAFVAPRVVVGHIETVVSWPDINLERTMQDSGEYFQKGKPENCWR